MERFVLPLDVVEELVSAYSMRVYIGDVQHCTLCGNCGVIDTRGVRTPAGLAVGRLNYCCCPNGLALRRQGADLEWWLAQRGQDQRIVKVEKGEEEHS